MADIKTDLRYTETHEWIKVDGNKVRVGLTAYATEKMGKDLAYIEIVKQPDEEVKKGEEVALLDVVKATEEVISPVSGKIIAINNALEDELERLSEDPYGEGWVVEIEISSIDELKNLLDAESYKSFITEKKE